MIMISETKQPISLTETEIWHVRRILQNEQLTSKPAAERPIEIGKWNQEDATDAIEYHEFIDSLGKKFPANIEMN